LEVFSLDKSKINKNDNIVPRKISRSELLQEFIQNCNKTRNLCKNKSINIDDCKSNCNCWLIKTSQKQEELMETLRATKLMADLSNVY
jgi:hypothetical protein